MRITLGGIFTLRPTSSVTMRPLPVRAAIILGAESAIKAIAITVMQTRLRRAPFNSWSPTKKPREDSEALRQTLSREE
jgi:hypothetical protein